MSFSPRRFVLKIKKTKEFLKKLRCQNFRYLIVYLQKGCRDNLVYYCDFEKINYKINGKLPITEIVGRLEADYEYVTNVGTEFIFRTNKNASNYR